MMHCRKTYSAARDCSTKAAILSTWISATARPVSYTRRSWAGSRSMEPISSGIGGRMTKAWPVCSSMDGKSGLNIRTGEICECDKCPCNQYGSDPNGGKGKACKNMRRIYLMRSNDPNLYLLTVPPTSIKEVNKALTRIMASKGIPYTNLIVGFKLAKATNANGINYATVVVDKRGILPPAVAQTAKAMRQEIKAKYKEIAITMDDYSTSASSNTMAADESALDVQVSDTEFTDVTDKDKDLPFV